MADEEKALEDSTGSLANDKSSDESQDSKAIEAGIQYDFRRGIHEKDLASKAELHDLENGSTSPESHGPDERPSTDPNLVDWEGENDPENPLHFSLKRKIWMSTMASCLTFGVSFSSSVFSADTAVTAEKFNVSEEVMILGVSLYVLGFSCGMFEAISMSLDIVVDKAQAHWCSARSLSYMGAQDHCSSASSASASSTSQSPLPRTSKRSLSVDSLRAPLAQLRSQLRQEFSWICGHHIHAESLLYSGPLQCSRDLPLDQ